LTGLYDRTPGVGHNHPHDHSHELENENQQWDRWAKKRTFVRALEGTYSHLYESLVNEPRVYSSTDFPWKGGPGLFGKHIISPHTSAITQSIETHIEVYGPGTYGQKHGHLNSAVFYVLKGRGHDVHDGRRIDWKAGDIMIVENGCVHQHFNDDPNNECLLLVFTAKPLFQFMNLVFQTIVSFPPTAPAKGNENFQPPSDL